MAKKTRHRLAKRNLFRGTLARFVGERQPRRHRRLDALRRMPLLQRFAPRDAIGPPDPVTLAIFAIDRVGPAAVRACASGVEVCVAAPDEATAEVFRAALAETARRRGTDRLIRIVVD
jgi:hypothetical protein